MEAHRAYALGDCLRLSPWRSALTCSRRCSARLSPVSDVGIPFSFKRLVGALIQNRTAPTSTSSPVDRATPVPTDVYTALSAASFTSVRHWPASTATLGEITGYLLGKAVNGIVTGGRWFTRFESMAGKRFDRGILVFAFMPAPIDFVGMLAGVAGYPPWRFIAIACLGKVLKITLLTVAASYSLPLIIDFLS